MGESDRADFTVARGLVAPKDTYGNDVEAQFVFDQATTVLTLSA
jgi:hypothetical protein